eukprot:TRINITY_DN3708_c2_g1_i3.p1 TRINITY_DN3708_c2_g1~~TRINITY_DN3708_c2_g1_i3.p1  ORF type:complete len:275 (+),score=-23.14 TRINITY_DN3708_c2_g1_i3:178-1002(+)
MEICTYIYIHTYIQTISHNHHYIPTPPSQHVISLFPASVGTTYKQQQPILYPTGTVYGIILANLSQILVQHHTYLFQSTTDHQNCTQLYARKNRYSTSTNLCISVIKQTSSHIKLMFVSTQDSKKCCISTLLEVGTQCTVIIVGCCNASRYRTNNANNITETPHAQSKIITHSLIHIKLKEKMNENIKQAIRKVHSTQTATYDYCAICQYVKNQRDNYQFDKTKLQLSITSLWQLSCYISYLIISQTQQCSRKILKELLIISQKQNKCIHVWYS